MRSYERFTEQASKHNIDTLPKVCPKCGGSLDYRDWPDETYGDGTFERVEWLDCGRCGLRVIAKQVYVASELTLEVKEA